MSGMSIFIASSLLIVWMIQESRCSLVRAKRIINGVEFNGRPSNYKVIKYVGLMGTAHGFTWTGGKRIIFYYYGEMTCTGSLVAPMIFQTACHCVATFGQPQRESFLSPAEIKDLWLDRQVVYVGVSFRFGNESNTMQSSSPVLTERFMLHSQCGLLREGSASNIIYDFAVVKLEGWWSKDVRRSHPWTEINWAPQYPRKQILEFHEYALEKQLVCMHIGFGPYARGDAEENEVLRHGWAALIPQPLCIRYNAGKSCGALGYYRWAESERKAVENITWVCTVGFAKHDQPPAGEDSGSPLTCEGHYYGLLSDVLINACAATSPSCRQKYNTFSRFHTLNHNLYVNALEYRCEIMRHVLSAPNG